MAERKHPPVLAQDLLRIHRVITRGLNVSLSCGADFQQTGFPTTGTLKGYLLYTQSLAAVLGAHHLGEDEIAFPYLKEKIPAAPYERLARSHQEIIALLDSTRSALPALEERRDQADLASLVDLLQNISSIWRPHIQTEEWYFSEDALAAAMSPEEQGRLSAAFSQHGQEHAAPPSLALPFMLFNLEADDRAAMAASLPRMLVEELIPKAWQQDWAPMKPFLLE
jgi:hypothetical protein